MRRAVVYLRVSTIEQTTANQERELREIAGRMGCDIVRVYKDHGISGTRGRDKRPAFDFLLRSDTVEGDTRVPHNASVISSTRRTDTPARYISISASSTELSRRR